MTKDKSYFLGKVRGFLDAFATLNSDGNESSGGMLFPLPEAETLEAACWKLVRTECTPSWHQKLQTLELVPAGASWRKRLSEELIGEALPGGYLLQLMDYRGKARSFRLGHGYLLQSGCLRRIRETTSWY